MIQLILLGLVEMGFGLGRVGLMLVIQLAGGLFTLMGVCMQVLVALVTALLPYLPDIFEGLLIFLWTALTFIATALWNILLATPAVLIVVLRWLAVPAGYVVSTTKVTQIGAHCPQVLAHTVSPNAGLLVGCNALAQRRFTIPFPSLV